MHFLAEKPEAGGEDRFVKPLLRMPAGIRQQVAGQMFENELIVRHVGIKCSNDVITILIGVRDGIVELVSSCLGIAHEIEPMPAPALAEMRRVEQTIDNLFD